jgi:hypothetical protein
MLYRNAETKSFALSTFYILISGPGKREAKSLILMLDFFSFDILHERED